MSMARKVTLNALPLYDQGTDIEVYALCWLFSIFNQTRGSIAWVRVHVHTVYWRVLQVISTNNKRVTTEPMRDNH